MIDRLAESHLVAVLGPSGCGKSSLVRVGLIPYLESGYLYRAGSQWVSATMEPGSRPITALANAFKKVISKSEKSNNLKEFPAELSGVESLLEERPDALVELSDMITPILGDRTNLLILIDQFEELFREDLASPIETTKLINLILNVFHAHPERLYIVITMRTDFLEQCSYYKGLPEALNQTQYLTPRLNDVELHDAIVKPLQLEHFGGNIEPDLVRSIIEEMGVDATYDPDSLPLMQHALMWLWHLSLTDANKTASKPILKLEDYKKFKGLSGCLSEHANLILAGLTEKQRKIAEVMFRLLGNLESGGNITRRVTTVDEIAAVAGVGREEVIPVIDAFTSKESGFLRWKDNR